jgi:hypothetical protein|tara:strand:- start:1293 stop:2189 length:897 start_codon:yes stop_codon:yes gene_type:complete
MLPEAVESYFGWINERHSIYQRRLLGAPPPWTNDSILQEYKFTNPFRENDRVTVWMRDKWTKPNDNRPHGEMIFNCCMFRMVGTSEFAEEHGWVEDFNPQKTKHLIESRLSLGKRTFTGAYIITNQGLKAPKSEVVVDHFLTPIWENKETLAKIAQKTQSLQALHEAMGAYKGWGGGGFMSYEVVTDLNYTPVLDKAKDRFTWANAGPGAIRGINRILGRDLKKGMTQPTANENMVRLLKHAPYHVLGHIPLKQIDMRTIEHSLCEWDKYERVRLGQGRPRSVYRPTLLTDTPKGAVE